MFWKFFESRVFTRASEIGIFASCFLRNIHILVDSSDVLFEVLTDGLEFLAIDTNHCKKVDLLLVLTLLNDKLAIYNLSTAPQVEKRKCDDLYRSLDLDSHQLLKNIHRSTGGCWLFQFEKWYGLFHLLVRL